jgi:sterol desaturase/sphingolipid hydroxylase (fatty acid hydroxylase superfamily)
MVQTAINSGTEQAVRLAFFVGTLALMAALEFALPRRRLVAPKARRWVTNIAIVALDNVMLRFGFPILAVGVAVIAEARGWGLLGLVASPGWLETLIALVVLDFAIWLQHVASHKIPILWRVHQMHHADRDIDVTTGFRFHPVEIALSMLWKFAVIVALGAGPLAVVIFEIILSALAMFNHANVAIPVPVDRLLRLVIVTPDMHRVHHSVIRRETDSNYGFNLSVWDRLFGTYRPQPEAGHTGMEIGLPQYRGFESARLDWSLLLPFRRRGDDR